MSKMGKQFLAAGALFMMVAPAVYAADLVVYSAGPKSLSGRLAKGFTAKTGIEVKLFQSNSGKVMARYQAEKSNPQVDVIVSASWGHAISLNRAGDLLPYISPNSASIIPSLKTGTYAAQGAAALAIAYNTKLGLPVPRDWSDLAQETYRNQITMPDPARSGSALTLVQALVSQNETEAWALFQKLRKNGLIVPGPNNAALNPVLQGAKGAVFGAVDYIALGLKAKGESIEVVYPTSGTVLAPRPVMIAKSSKNQESARKFVDYVLSPEGQEMVAKTLILPSRTDIAAQRPGWSDLNLINLDYAAAASHAAKIKKQFATIIRN